MAVKNESRREHNPVKTSSREAEERAEQLAPPEEQAGDASGAKRDDALSIDTGALKLPRGLRSEDDESTRSAFHLDPVVIFFLVAALAFIAFITYLISIEPAK
ncbi:MAG TPA: hypothetical protein VF735_02415 [Pyrinomonadaceae bacterium]|jgi:hypothetical protein